MLMKNKLGKKSFAIVGLAAMSMAAFTPVYAAEVPETKEATKTSEVLKMVQETNSTTTDSAVVKGTVTTDKSIWSDVYEDVKLETGKLYVRDASGKLIKLTDEQARAVNPLHDINLKRQSLIMDAVVSGDWHTYYAFEATQAPYHYDLNADGKIAPNKNYFGNLVALSHRAMVEARLKGDKETEQIWANDLKQTIEKYNAAPGMSVYIPQVNSNEADIALYGIQAPDKEFFDSVYNDNRVRTQGQTEAEFWYENEYFLDNPELMVEIVKSIKTYSKLSIDQVYSITSGYDKAVSEREKAEADKASADKAEADKKEADTVKVEAEKVEAEKVITE